MEAFNPAADFIDYLFSTIADDAIEQMLQEATEEGELMNNLLTYDLENSWLTSQRLSGGTFLYQTIHTSF